MNHTRDCNYIQLSKDWKCSCPASAKSGPTWKEELYKWWTHNPTNEVKHLIQVQEFISSQIIEKIIEDIPDDAYVKTGIPEAGKLYIGEELKQQLRDKYLKGDNE